MSRTSRWSRGLPLLRSLFPRARDDRRRDAELNVESLEERQVFAAPEVTLNITGPAIEQTDFPLSGATITDDGDITGMTVSLSETLDGADEGIAIDSAVVSGLGLTLTFESDTELTFSGAKSADDYQTLLRAITYRHSGDAPNESAQRKLTVSITDDEAETDSADEMFSVLAVNDPPFITLAGKSYSIGEDTTADFAGKIEIGDVDAGATSKLTVRITVASGGGVLGLSAALPAGLEVGASSDADFQEWTGTIADLNSALGLLQYTPAKNAVGDSTIELQIVDGGNTGDGGEQSASDVITITATAVDDAPELTDPDNTTVPYTEDATPVQITDSIVVVEHDGDLLQSATITITGAVAGDKLGLSAALPGWTIDDSTLGVLILTAPAGGVDAATMQAALRLATYSTTSQNPSGTRTIQFVVKDVGASGLTSTPVTRTVSLSATNDGPVLGGGGTVVYEENAATPVVIAPSLTVTDPDGNDAVSAISIAIAGDFEAGKDLLSISGGLSASQWTGAYNAATGVWTISPVGTRTIADAQTLLRTIRFSSTTDNPISARTITFSVTDAGGATGTTTATVSIDADNDPPALDVNVPLTVSEGGTATFSKSNLHIADPDNSPSQLKYTLAVALGSLAFGKLYNGSTQLVIGSSFTQADIDAGNITYVHGGLLSPLLSTDLFAFTITDGETTLGSVVPYIATINVADVNDAPTVTGTTTRSVDEDTTLTFGAGAITIGDEDSGTGDLTLSLAVSKGTLGYNTSLLTLSTGDDGDGSDGTLTLTGTLTELQAVLNSLTYKGNLNYNGSDTLVVTLNDNGNTGAGGALSAAPFSVAITVNAVNDAPTVTGTTTRSVDEDSTLSFGAGAITIGDVDAGTSDLTVAVAVSKGTLGYNTSLPGLTVVDGDGSNGTLSFKGSLANLQAFLDSLTYKGNLNYNGSDTLVVTLNDNGNTGSGGAKSAAPFSVAITVNSVNDAPTVTGTTTQSVDEDTTLSFGAGAITIGDVDAATGKLTVSLAVSDGTLGYNTGLLTLSTGDDGDGSDGTLTLTGTLTELQAVLNSLTYKGDLDFNGSDTLVVTLNDNGNTGSGGAQNAAPFSVAITVNAVNDAPTVTGTTNRSVDEDTTLTFGAGSITIDDVDAGTGELTIAVAVSKGTLGYDAGLPGLTVVDDIGSDGTLSFTGKLADLQAFLDSLTYKGNPNYNGSDTLVVTLNDNNTGSGGPQDAAPFSVAITVNAVNDAPTVTGTTTRSVDEDTTLTFGAGAITIGDVDAGSGTLTITLAVDNGSLGYNTSLPGLTVHDGDGSNGTLSFTGSLANLQAVLNSLTYKGNPNYSGSDTLVVTLNDNNNTGSGGPLNAAPFSVAITVNAVNDAPTVTGTTTRSVDEDTTLSFGAGSITIGDVDAATGELTVSLAVSKGTLGYDTSLLTLSAGDDGDGSDGTLTLTGTLAELQAALDSLTYNGKQDYNGSDTLVVTLNDNGNSGDGGAKSAAPFSVAITVNAVNDAPTVSGTTTRSVDEDTTLSFGPGSITIDDVDAASGALTITLAVSHGSLGYNTSLPGLTIVDNNGSDGTLSFKGTLTSLQAFLDSLTYKGNPNYSGSDTLVVTLNDNGNTGGGDLNAAPFSVAITVNAVNDAPTVAGTTTRSVDEDTTLTFGAGSITIGDVDAGSGTLTITLAVANGSLAYNTSLPGLTIHDGDGSNGTLSFTGKLADLQAVLDSLTYKGAPNFNGSDTVVVTLNDNGITGSGGAKSAAPFDVAISVNAVNDAPTVTGATTQSVDEDTTLSFGTGSITIGDVDAATGELTLSLAVDHGSLGYNTSLLTLSAGDDGDGSDGTLTLTGTLAELQAVLDSLTYKGDLNFNGSDTLVVTLTDNGNTGSGGPLSAAPFEVVISVASVNNAPTVTGTTTRSVDEDTTLSFGAGSITIDDVDAATGELTLSLAVSKGTLAYDTSLLTLSAGDDGDGSDGTLTLTGTLTELQAVLDSLTYKAALNYNGGDTLVVTLNDNGNTGDGGPLSAAPFAVAMTVNAVNDAPTITAPTSATTTEGGTIVFTGGNAISVADLDIAPTDTKTITVTVEFTDGEISIDLSGVDASDDASDGNITFEGTLSEVNAALATLQWKFSDPDQNGDAQLTVTVNDGGHIGGGPLSESKTIDLHVTAVNDAPSVSTPAGPVVVAEDQPVTFSGISVADIDVAETSGGVLEVTLKVTNGTLTLTDAVVGLTIVDGDGSDGTLTWKGSVAALNDALSQLQYQGKLDFNGADALEITVNDLGNTGAPVGVGLTDSATLAIDVTPVNDPPVIDLDSTTSGNDATGKFTEGDAATPIAPNATLSDVDDANLKQMVITLTNRQDGAAESLILPAAPVGLDVVIDDAAGYITITVTGVADKSVYEAYLRQIAYLNTSENPSEDVRVVTVTVMDEADDLSATQEVHLDVVRVNDAPTISAPSGVSIDEDKTIAFTGANQIQVADVDSAGQPVSVTLTVGNGTLTITGSTAALDGSKSDFDGSDGTITLVGSIDDVNAALLTLEYVGDANFNTGHSGLTETLVVTISDQGNGSSASAAPVVQSATQKIDVEVKAVNDPPEITSPTTVTTNEDVAYVFNKSGSTISIADDATESDQVIQVSLSVTRGTIELTSFPGLTFPAGANGSGAFTVEGTVAAINAALASLRFTPDQDDDQDVVLSIHVNDQAGTGSGGALTAEADVLIDVVPQNDPPVVTGSGPFTTNEDQPIHFSPGAINITDVDAGADDVTVTVSVAHGVLTLGSIAGLTGDVDGSDGQLVITGSLAAVNAALDTLVYTPNLNYNGGDTLHVEVDDLGHNGEGTNPPTVLDQAITVVAINDDPTITQPANISVNEDETYIFAPGELSIDDVDLDPNVDVVTVTLQVAHGTLARVGGAIVGLNEIDADGADGTLTWTGTLDAINAALALLRYQGEQDFFGPDSLTIIVDDGGQFGDPNGLGEGVTVGVTAIDVLPVNDPPTVDLNGAGAGEDYTTTAPEQTSTPIAPNAVIADVDDAMLESMTITLTNVLDGTFEHLNALYAGPLVVSLNVVGNTIELTFTGSASVSEYQAALRSVHYYNDSDNPDETPRVVTVVVNDGDADSITRTVTIDVERINDSPTIAAPGGATVAEDATLTFTGSNEIVVTDVDAANGNLTVTLTVKHGTLSVGSPLNVTGDLDGSDGTLTLTGKLADINAALGALVYQGDLNFNTPYGGAEQLVVNVNDQGNSSHQGAPDPQTAEVLIPITVTAVNDPPTITAPASVTLAEDGSILISSVGTLSITDPDEHESGVAQPLTVTVTAQHGVLLVDAGAYTATISGQGTSSLVIHGAEAEVNAVLAMLRFQPHADFNDNLGQAGIDVVVSDNGNTGAGPVGTASHHIDVSVTAVNDVPTVNSPPGFTINEDTPNAPIPSGSVFIINDIDAAEVDANATLRVTLTAVHGTLVVGSPGGATVSGDGSALVTIEGTVAQINAALASLLFTPTANFNDGLVVPPDLGARITISVDDQGHTGAANGLPAPTSTVFISVRARNDAPTIDAPASVQATEDTTFAFTGANAIQIDDVDVAETGFQDPQVTVVLTVQHGRLNVFWTPTGSPTDPTVTGDGLSQLTISGRLDDVNAILATLLYTPDLDFNDNISAESLSIDVRDNGNVGDGGEQTAHHEVAILVAAQNDAPTIVAPTEVHTSEDTSVAVGGIVVSDVDARENDVYAPVGYVKPSEVTVTLTALHGTLSVSVIPLGDPLDASDDTIVVGNGTGVLTISGRLDYVNAALASLRFTPDLDFNDNLAATLGAARIDVSVTDNGNTGAGAIGTATASIDVKIAPVNDAPTVVVPAHQTTSEDVPLAFTGANAIVIDDVDATETTVGDQISVALTVAHGSLAVDTTGLSVVVTSDGLGGLTITGSLAEVRLALASLIFTPTAYYSSDPAQPAGFGRINVVVNDLGNTGSGGALTANGAVTIQIDAVANEPTLNVTQPTDGTEGVWLPLTITALSIDTDGSETVTIYLHGVPLNGTLSAGVNQGGGAWKLTQAQLTGLKIRVDDQDDADGAITGRAISVVAVTTERDNGDQAETIGGFALTINNSLPVFTVPTGGLTINEGGVVQLSGSFTDLGRYDSHVVEINWGDGTSTILQPVGSGAFDENAGGLTTNYKFGHIYLNDSASPSQITVTIRDEVGGDTLASYLVTVDNVRPTFTGSSDGLNVNEQQPLKLPLPFTDPGKQDTFTVRVNFGDGTHATFTHSQVNVVPGVVTYDPSVVDANGNLMPTGVTLTTFSAAINHKYVLPDFYTMTIEVRDSDSAPFTTAAVITVLVADLPGVGVELPTAPGAPPLLVPPPAPTLQVPLLQLPVPAVVAANLGAGGQTGSAEGQKTETPSTLKIQVVLEKISRFRGKALGVEFTDILFANQINLVLERVGKLDPGTYRVTLSAAGMPALVHEFSVASTDGNSAQRSLKTLWQEVQTREKAGGQNRGFQFLDSAQNAPPPAPAADSVQPTNSDGTQPTSEATGATSASGDVTAAEGQAAPAAPEGTPLSASPATSLPGSASDLTAGSVAALAAVNALAAAVRKPSALKRLLGVFRGFL